MISKQHSTRTGRIGAAVLAAGMVGFAPLPAFAHDAVVNSSPQEGAVVREFPEEISVEFSGMIKPDFNTFAITNMDSGEQILTGEPAVDGQYAKLAVPADQRGGDGKYQLGYQITSSDGHATRGRIRFEVNAKGEATPSTEAAESSASPQQSGEQQAQSSEQKETSPMFGILAGVAAAVMLIGVLVVVLKQRRS